MGGLQDVHAHFLLRGLDATLGCRKIDCISFSLGSHAVADGLHHEREAA
jgi:hypothetical protein